MSIPLSTARGALVALLVIVIAGCSSGGGGGRPAAAPARSTSILTAREMEANGVATRQLSEAVRNLRPGFLRIREVGEREGPVEVVQVSINGAIPGGLTLLEDIRANTVASVTLLSAADALHRFGMRDVMGPVLLVTLK